MSFDPQYPVSPNSYISQDYDGHVARAIKNGWCYLPGNCPSGIYYYGAIDFAIPVGTPVYACESSVAHIEVQNQGKNGYGLNVRITHADGYYSIYAHLSSVVVQSGDDVLKGQLIGYSGGAVDSPTSGNSTGPHLHFEIRLNGRPVDPAPLLAGGSVEPPVPPPSLECIIPETPTNTIILTPTIIVTKYINIRSQPDSSARDLGDVYYGDELIMLDKTKDPLGNVWVLGVKMGSIPVAGWVAACYGGEVWLEEKTA